jgi:heptosyltransferase-3
VADLIAARPWRLRLAGAAKSFRRNSRRILGLGIARLLGPREDSAEITTENISSVLICRINGRLGNAVFLTPLITRIHELLPSAAIDIAISYPKAPELFHTIPGLRNVISFPHKGVGMVTGYFAALFRLRAQQYDLAIDPIPESTSGRIVMALCRARHRIGFATGSQWAPLTHVIPEPSSPMHQAVLPVFLFSQALRQPYDPRNLHLSLCLRPEEMESGRSAITLAVASATGPGSSLPSRSARTFGFFAHATGSKTIDPAWWRAFWKAFLELEPASIPVEFLPPGQSNIRTDTRFPTVQFSSPRDLTAAMAATRMFISADTGPMHLASSTAIPTVALFRSSDPTLYGPLKSTDLAINISERSPQLVAHDCHRLWQASA